MEKKKALGRGMASLIPDPSSLEEGAPPPKTYFYCDIENVIPNKDQPRKNFTAEKVLELADSIREKGIIQPLLVRRLSEFKFGLIAGERRWRAAQKAGLRQVPVIIRESSPGEVLEEALIENIQREDLNDIEEAKAYNHLIEKYGYKQDQVAKKLGKNRSTIANSLRLLALTEGIQALLVEKKLSAGHARALLSLEDKKRQIEIAKQIISQGLSVRQVEALVKVKGDGKKQSAAPKKDDYIVMLENELSQHFKAKFRIHPKGKKGKIEIEYFGEEELNRIISLLKA